jgi:hypothetical protein
VANDTTTNQDYFFPMMTENQTSGSVTATRVSSTKLYFNPSTGDLSATNFNSVSDFNKKKDVVTVDNSLDLVNSMRGVYFNWRDDGRAGVGVIAQEMEKVLPQVVKKTPAGDRTVEYGGITGVLIEAIKELSDQLDQLKSLYEKSSKG